MFFFPIVLLCKGSSTCTQPHPPEPNSEASQLYFPISPNHTKPAINLRDEEEETLPFEVDHQPQGSVLLTCTLHPGH